EEVEEELYVGRVRSYAASQGYGFIECQDTSERFGRDIFLHRSQVEEGSIKRAKPGDLLRFTLELNEKGHPQARNVERYEEPKTSAKSAGEPDLQAHVGRVKTFSSAMGYGFISCDETWARYQKDVFLHNKQAAEAGIAVGDTVRFTVELKDGGRPQARDVQKASEAAPAPAPPAGGTAPSASLGDLFRQRRALLEDAAPLALPPRPRATARRQRRRAGESRDGWPGAPARARVSRPALPS
ncbi:unnamed protein product, partial [Prorocentrum cordatum]